MGPRSSADGGRKPLLDNHRLFHTAEIAHSTFETRDTVLELQPSLPYRLLLLGVAASQRLVIKIVLAVKRRNFRALVSIVAAKLILRDGVIITRFFGPVIRVFVYAVSVRVPHALKWCYL